MMAAALTDTVMTLGELLGPVAGSSFATPVTDLVLDSRAVRPGAAFVAVQGGREHGLRYTADALSRGAAAVLYDSAASDLPPGLPGSPGSLGAVGSSGSAESVDSAGPAGSGSAEWAGSAVTLAPAASSAAVPRGIAVPDLENRLGDLASRFYGRALGSRALCGITGTNGKTTVAYLLAQAMTRRGDACGYLGTLGFGVPPRLTTHALTTPDVFTLHKELATLEASHVALEVSSHALAQNRIAGLSIETAAFTNLTRDHLDEHGDLDSYGRAKARLFARDDLRQAVLNVGDPFAAFLAERLPPAAHAIRVGIAGHAGITGNAAASRRTAEPAVRSAPRRAAAPPDADIVATVRSLGFAGLELAISGRYGSATLESPLIGDFNAENLLVALGVMVAWQVPLAAACDALAGCAPPPGRLEVLGTGPWVVVDYAHTPDGLQRVLDALSETGDGDLWCVFGCGGDRDRGKRPLMGALAAERANHIVVTDDNPRSENPVRIVADIMTGVDDHPSVVVEHDRRAAILHAVRRAKPDDVVLVAGKGHETTQSSAGEQRPFSDRAVALEALGERS